MNHYHLTVSDNPTTTDLKTLAYMVLFGQELQIQRLPGKFGHPSNPSSLYFQLDEDTIVSNQFGIDTSTGVPLDDAAIMANFKPVLHVSCQLPFSLQNIENPSLVQTMKSSEHSNTFESVDKPIIEVGDLVVVCTTNTKFTGGVGAYATERAEIESNLDEYLMIENNKAFYIGLANSSKSDFNDPLATFQKVIIGKRNFSRLNEMILGLSGFTPEQAKEETKKL